MIRRFLLSLLTLTLLSWPAHATWSILIVNHRTGEVAIGSATCLTNINLARLTPTVVIGRGIGVVQAAGNSALLPLIAQGIRDGLTPEVILANVDAADMFFNSRQIGIVSFDGPPVTFTGGGAGRWKGGVVGTVGELSYAIQGNVLTGAPVVLMAEAAVLNTPGDMTQKLMAAMVAAKEAGGDGRCSCELGNPTGCGETPESFEKSAHVGFVIVARKGDTDSPCLIGNDCAEGPYFFKLNIRGLDSQAGDPDPVDQLVERYALWRANRSGRPDGLLSVTTEVPELPADGATATVVTVQLVDIEGDPLMSGGADMQVIPAEGTTPSASVGVVTDNGDGTYSFPVTAGTEVGTDAFVITATDDFLTATLSPCLEVTSVEVQAGPLTADTTELSAALGGTVGFELDVEERPHGVYWILGTLSGTDPGIHLGSLFIPLNPDRLTIRTLVLAGRPDILPGTFGFLDDDGHADAAFIAQPRMLLDLVGLRMDWAAMIVGFGGPPLATNAVGFDILP
jgi:hypothetical protein